MFNHLSPDEKVTLIQHLDELRKVLVVSMVAIVIAAFGCFYFSDQLLTYIKQPLTNLNLQLYYIGVAEGFFIKLKLSLIAGLVVAFPVVSLALWRFVKPALYPGERKYVYILYPVTVLLFVGGVVFSYLTVLQVALKFLIFVASGLEPMITVDKYVSFVIAFTLPFGFVFELPVIVYFLTKIGVVTPAWLALNRKYALLIIFVLAAALTPGPDPISQCLMGVPVYLLYELSIIVSRLARPSKERISAMEVDEIRADLEDESTDTNQNDKI
ncbi:MAG: twin-arginine translocase subunit TatC [Methylocystaceae bacterium]